MTSAALDLGCLAGAVPIYVTIFWAENWSQDRLQRLLFSNPRGVPDAYTELPIAADGLPFEMPETELSGLTGEPSNRRVYTWYYRDDNNHYKEYAPRVQVQLRTLRAAGGGILRFQGENGRWYLCFHLPGMCGQLSMDPWRPTWRRTLTVAREPGQMDIVEAMDWRLGDG